MNLTLIRHNAHNCKIGLLYVENELFCYTIDLPYKKNKPFISCIPADVYEVGFRREDTPLTKEYRERYDYFEYHIEIKNVPGRDYIYIHVGNTIEDLDGCTSVGRSAGVYYVNNSFSTYERLYKRLYKDLENYNVSINIIDY